MTTLFPGALDNFTDPTGTAMLGATTPKHSEHHANINDAIEAIEATIGETGSTDPASVEKRLVDVISAAASAAADATSAQAAAALVALDLASLDASIGTAGYLDVGTGPNNVVQLDGTGKLPAVDGSQLTGISGGGGGVTDHGALTGLADDDHTQYHNDARGDARYALIAKGVTNGDTHDHSGGDGAQIDYTTLANLPTLGTAAAAATGDFTAAAHATDTANPHSVTKSQVGLANADNTSDANKPVSTAQQTALDLKANIASPTFTGTVGGITAAMVGAPSGSGTSTGTNTGDSATPAETTTTIGSLINGATSKTTPVDADQVGLMDSAASNVLKKLSWANIKTTLASIFAQLSGATFTGTINVASAKNVTITQADNELIVIPSKDAAATLATFPGPKVIWHDRLAFGKGYGVPTFEVYTGSWAAGTLDAGLFSQQENRSVQQINGTTETACRWTWNHANVAFSYPQWWFIGVTYVPTAAAKNITIESSPDGVTWTTRHTTTGDTNTQKCLALYATTWGSEQHVRLTITVTNGQPLKLSTIRALSSRWGDQGGGSEQENPFQWDDKQRVAFGNSLALSPNASAQVIVSGPGYGAPVTSGTTQTYGSLRVQEGVQTAVLDFGINSTSCAWIQSTKSNDLSTSYALALNPNGGNVSMGTLTGTAQLNVIKTSEQVRIGYDSGNYESSLTDSAGATTKTLVGVSPNITWTVSNATTNVIYDLATFSKNCTGAGAAGLGVRINLAAKSSTTANVVQGALSTSWVDATHATRKGRTRLWVADSTGLREGFCAEADGTQIKTSVNGVAAVARAAALTAEIPGDATRDELRLTELYNACKAFGIIN
ncbi:hypothetical protein KC887_06485 [Candidatus Kaiserbacteria bacterium]|nr:hypothetical protein [Candidatus Kaiserbacteria bacterium]